MGNGGVDLGRARMAVVAALVGFVAYLAVPSGIRTAALVVMVAAACAVVVCAVSAVRHRAGTRTVTGIAAASAVGLVGSVLYLDSLADEPTAIPIAGPRRAAAVAGRPVRVRLLLRVHAAPAPAQSLISVVIRRRTSGPELHLGVEVEADPGMRPVNALCTGA